jgi:hypothetical protein
MSTLRVAGSGKNITKLLSTVSSEVNDSTQGAILGADEATIRDLALEVTLVGGTGKSTGIFQGFSSGAATIQDVSIKISSSSSGTVVQCKVFTLTPMWVPLFRMWILMYQGLMPEALTEAAAFRQLTIPRSVFRELFPKLPLQQTSTSWSFGTV